MFSVVVFEGPKESVGTIPTKWLNQTKSECKWPVKDIQNSIKNKKDPEKSWNSYPVRVISTKPINDYSKALELEKRAEATSSLETTDTDQKKRNKKRKKPQKPSLVLVRDISSYEPKSDDSEVSLTPSMISLVAPSEDDVENHVREAVLLNNLASTTEDTAAQTEPQPTIPPSSAPGSGLNYTVLLNRHIAFEKQVLTTLAEIKADIRELLRRSSNSSPAEASSSETIPFDLPVQNADILLNLNEWATSVDNYNSLVNFLASIGGSDVGKIVRNILGRLICGTLARQINCTGVHDKISFDALVLKKAVIAAVRCNKGFEFETEVKIKSAIQKWFRNSRDLEGGHKQRKQKNVVVQK